MHINLKITLIHLTEHGTLKQDFEVWDFELRMLVLQAAETQGHVRILNWVTC